MNSKFWGNVALSAVVFCLVAFAVTKISASSTGISGVLLPEITISESAEELLHSVALVHSSVKVPRKGHMVEAAFSIENKGGNDIKNISVMCTLFDSAGKERGRNKWIVFETVKAQTLAPFIFVDKMFVSNSVVRSDCIIVDMQIAQAPMVKAHVAAEHGASDSGHDSTH